ncbi:MAG: hypothetical protein OEV40_28350 [Acidimicrobiia bacterium]|nr:hypothetical protein [Acidimicrobiia bacterium]
MEDPGLGPFDPDQVQIHDFNSGDLNEPGKNNYFMDGGLFWTSRMPGQGARLRRDGKAEMHLDDHPLFDFVNAVNAIVRPPGFPQDPSRATVDVLWSPTGNTKEVSGTRFSGNGSFAGTYYQTDVDITWSAKNLVSGYEFSTEGSSSTTITAQFSAKVRNGVFA